jgi:hypothetical protein
MKRSQVWWHAPVRLIGSAFDGQEQAIFVGRVDNTPQAGIRLVASFIDVAETDNDPLADEVLGGLYGIIHER